mgnify:CR=1 FL=1
MKEKHRTINKIISSLIFVGFISFIIIFSDSNKDYFLKVIAILLALVTLFSIFINFNRKEISDRFVNLGIGILSGGVIVIVNDFLLGIIFIFLGGLVTFLGDFIKYIFEKNNKSLVK